MGGCAAANCTNHSRKGFRMFRFPTNGERRKIWAINCRRGDDWEPGPAAQICSEHFEENQFEDYYCQDLKNKLKQDAIPTNVPNKPPLLASKRLKGTKNPKPGSQLKKIQIEQQKNTEKQDLKKRIELLEKQIQELQGTLDHREKRLLSFLSPEQIKFLNSENEAVKEWSNDSIIKSLKLRFALGKHGYNYLRSTGYPMPAYNTLNRRMHHIKSIDTDDAATSTKSIDTDDAATSTKSIDTDDAATSTKSIDTQDAATSTKATTEDLCTVFKKQETID